MYCFGVANNSPLQVVDFLVKAKIIGTASDVLIARSGDVLPAAKPKKRVLFLVAMQDFCRNLPTLNSAEYAEVIVVVFASALRLVEIKGCVPFDFVPVREQGGVVCTEQPLSKMVLRAGQKIANLNVRRERRDFIGTMIDGVKRGSLLNPLMTFIYSLPSATHQTPVKKACARYMYEGQTFDQMLKDLLKSNDLTLTDRAVAKMRSILESDVGRAFVCLFAEYRSRKNPETLQALCDKYSASPYEVRYILSVVGVEDPTGGNSPKGSADKRQKKTDRKKKNKRLPKER